MYLSTSLKTIQVFCKFKRTFFKIVFYRLCKRIKVWLMLFNYLVNWRGFYEASMLRAFVVLRSYILLLEFP